MYKKVALTMAAVLVAVFSAAVAYSADNDPVTVAGILKAAGCPLTDAQAKQIADYTPPQRGQGGGGQRPAGGQGGGMYAIFDAKQIAALGAKLGSMQGRGDNATSRPRNLTQLILLEKAGLPLTERQVALLKAISVPQGAGREGFQQMAAQTNAVYTEAQRAALEKLGLMGGGRRPQ
jgi:hypothetical protein